MRHHSWYDIEGPQSGLVGLYLSYAESLEWQIERLMLKANREGLRGKVIKGVTAIVEENNNMEIRIVMDNTLKFSGKSKGGQNG